MVSGVPTRCVVFDIDDTLYLERDYVRSGFGAVGRWIEVHLGVSGFSDLAWRAFQAGTRGTIFDDVLRELALPSDPELVGSLVTVYREHEPAITMLPDAQHVVDALSHDTTLGVVTDGPLESQRAKARVLAVDDWSSVSVFTSEWGEEYWKPHRRAFEFVEATSGCRGAQCVYLADNPAKDFVAPASMGWSTIRVRRVGSLHERVPSGDDVQHEVADLDTVLELLAPGSAAR
jgi:putative hydrolase of the HAD superfamily